MSTPNFIALIVLLGVMGYLGFDLLFTRWGKDMREEFEAEFPGQCAYCSLIEYGISHGQEPRNAMPKPHNCKENMARLRRRVPAGPEEGQ